jgi:hypothetical protein
MVLFQGPPPQSNYGLIEEKILTVAVSSVDFTGLSINRDKVYVLFTSIGNPTGSDTDIKIYVNADYTDANYYTEYYEANAAVTSIGRGNIPKITGVGANGSSIAVSTIFRDPLGYFKAVCNGTFATGAGICAFNTWISKVATVTDITSIRVLSSIANGLSIGSRLALYSVN